MDEAGFDIFGDEGPGRPGSIEEIFNLVRHSVDEHGMDFEEAVNIIIDLIRPGTSDNSHDVKPIFVGAMHAYGYGDVVEKFEAVYLTIMPWGVGFSIQVERGLRYEELEGGAQQAIVKSLCVVLQSGGMKAYVNDNNHIILTSPDGEETDLNVDDIVSQFRVQLEKELGPDGEEPEDPMKRWMP